MGLSRAAIRFLVREHIRRPFGGTVLTLGRQFLFATPAAVLQVCREEGFVPHDLPCPAATASNIPAWQGTTLAGNLSDVALFRLLGVSDVVALDRSPHEGAEILWDLNEPVPAELESRFDLILDAGTMEHAFDVRRVLMNIASMLAPRGRVIHMNPANNYVNHGFYQFGPTFFCDYYAANGFQDLQCFVVDQIGRDPRYAAWDLFAVEPRHQPVCLRSPRPMLAVCVAQKTAHSTGGRVPVQAYYRHVSGPGADEARDGQEPQLRTPRLKAFLKRVVPLWLRNLLRPYLLEGHRRPWGLRRAGRLR